MKSKISDNSLGTSLKSEDCSESSILNEMFVFEKTKNKKQ